MSNDDALYEDAKDDLQAVSGPLFEFAVDQLGKRDAFLPFAATLDSDGGLTAHAAAPEHELTDATEVLPLLHEGLRESISADTRAVAVCEWVTVTLEGERATEAIKVLVEHANGITVAFYLPMRKRLLGKWQPGEILVVPADPEVGLVQ